MHGADGGERALSRAGGEESVSEELARLRASEARFKDFAEASADWLWEMDADLRLSHVTRPGRDASGIVIDDVIGKTRWEVARVDPEGDEAWRRHRDDLLARRPFRDFRYRLTVPDGSWRHLRTSGTPVFDGQGRFQGYRGAASDETATVEARLRAEWAEGRLREALGSLSEGFIVYGKDERVVSFDEGYRRLFPEIAALAAEGATLEQILRFRLARGHFPAAEGREEAWLGEILKRHRDPHGPYEQRYRDGRIMLVAKNRLSDEGISALLIDITALKATERAASERDEQLRSIAENLPGFVFQMIVQEDGTRRYAYASSGLRELCGLEPEELLARPESFTDLIHPDDRPARDAAIERSVRETAAYDHEMRLNTRNNGTRWVRSLAKKRTLANGTILWNGVTLDVTALKDAEKLRDHLAYHDQLTGLPNLRLFHDRLSQAVLQAERVQGKAAVACLDFPAFSDVRVGLGLAAADEITRRAAERLQAALVSGDTIAHIGGGQFYVLLGGIASSTDAAPSIRKVIEAFDEPISVAGAEIYARPVMGISLYPDDGSDAEAVLRNANTALIKAKATRGQSYEFYSAQMAQGAAFRVSTERELRRAIDEEALELHYQATVQPMTFAINGVEALVRWRHPERGIVSPANFIPLAEQTGLIVPLGELVLRLACRQAARWRAMGLCNFPISVNVSGLQLMREDFPARVMAILAESGLPPEALKIELTESTILRDIDTVTRAIHELSERGIVFAVDDFGIEHSALSHLSELPIDTLKVDHSFVMRMTRDTAHAALVLAIITMTHAMQKKAVAEGVETQEEVTYLRAYQCDSLQGYLFTRPVPADECEAQLIQKKLLPKKPEV